MRKSFHIVTRSVECTQTIVIFLLSAGLGNQYCIKQAYQAASLTTSHVGVKAYGHHVRSLVNLAAQVSWVSL